MVRFQLDNVIRLPTNTQRQGKMDINLQLIIDHHFMIGIMHILN